MSAVIHVQDFFHHFANDGIAVGRIDDIGDHGQAAQVALDLGIAEQFVAELAFAFFELQRLGAQHQVGKIHVPWVWRYIGALGLITQIAHEALVDHLPVICLGDTVHLHGR